MRQRQIDLSFLDTPEVTVDLKFLDTHDTELTPTEEANFQTWKQKYAPQDSGEDYDLRGAFKEGLTPDPKTGHWPDTYKKPNHPTFSDESKYAAFGNPGRWNGDTFEPAAVSQGARDVQVLKYPTSKERGGTEGEAIYGTRTLGDIFSGRGLLTAGKTALTDLYTMGRSLGQPLWGIKTLGEGLTASRERSEDIAGRQFAEGDYGPAFTRGLINMVPGGPMALGMAEESVNDPAVGVGHVVAAKVAPRVAEAVRHPIETVKAPFRASGRAYRAARAKATDLSNAEAGMTANDSYFKALRPLNAKSTYGKALTIKGVEKAPASVEVSRLLVNEAANDLGIEVTDLDSHDVALEHALEGQIGKQRQLRGTQAIVADGTPIADAIKRAIPKIDRVENPAAVAEIEKWADETYAKDFEFEELDELRKDANASRAGYHGKLPLAQMNLDRTLDSAIKGAKVDAIRNVEYGALENMQGTGEGLRAVNQNIKSLLDTMELRDRRFNVDKRQAVQNLPQQVSKFMAAGKFGKAAKNLLAGNYVGAGIDALTGMSEVALADFLKELNSTNGQLGSAFRRTTARPPAIPMNPVGRYQRALGAAGRGDVLPATETGQASPGQPLEAQGWNRPAALERPQGLRAGLDQFMTTGTASESLPSPTGGTFGSDLVAADHLATERAAGRLGLQRQGGPPASQRPGSTTLWARLRGSRLPSSGQTRQMPAPVRGLLPEKASPAANMQLARDARGRLLPVNEGLTLKDVGEYARGNIERDPKTGRFRKARVGDSEPSHKKKGKK